ncbi:hypothetical protein V1477_000914 [Vespula maculifrons]|uniref:Uncharacterized protein n=1 Tax=Vespula maculifrons TaxID=7453 RepID=A0ABD2D0I2_VESMC
MTQIYVLFLASLTSSRFSRISRDRIESVVVLRLPELRRCSSFEGLRATTDFEEFPELQYSFECTSSYVSSIIQDGIGIRILFRIITYYDRIYYIFINNWVSICSYLQVVRPGQSILFEYKASNIEQMAAYFDNHYDRALPVYNEIELLHFQLTLISTYFIFNFLWIILLQFGVTLGVVSEVPRGILSSVGFCTLAVIGRQVAYLFLCDCDRIQCVLISTQEWNVPYPDIRQRNALKQLLRHEEKKRLYAEEAPTDRGSRGQLSTTNQDSNLLGRISCGHNYLSVSIRSCYGQDTSAIFESPGRNGLSLYDQSIPDNGPLT